MKVVCGWCGAMMRDEDGTKPVGGTSHGICPPCFERVEAEARIAHERRLIYKRIIKRHVRSMPACQSVGGL